MTGLDSVCTNVGDGTLINVGDLYMPSTQHENVWAVKVISKLFLINFFVTVSLLLINSY